MLAQRQDVNRIDPFRLLFDRYTRIPKHFRVPGEAFRQKTNVDFERGDFQVKTLGTLKELEEVLQLRYEIFHREFQKKLFPYGIDLEPLDFVADHLVIKHKPTNRIVGTYRIVSSNFSNDFYSQSEFEMSDFLNLPGTKMELSRAGIHRGFRNGVVMALLWRGVSKYMKEVGAEYIFGCASVKTVSVNDVNSICAALDKRGRLSDEFKIRPNREYKMGIKQSSTAKEAGPMLLPALFEGYLRAGAIVSPEPALDRDFKCVDFLTVLKVREMNRQFERKYGK